MPLLPVGLASKKNFALLIGDEYTHDPTEWFGFICHM